MGEDLFSDIARWWREGAEAGANQPAFGPKVGRGLFSNWFLSERDREVEELVTLHADVEAAHDASRLGEGRPAAAIVSEIMLRAFSGRKEGLFEPLVHALYDPLYDLVFDEFVWFPRYDDGDIDRLEMATRVELRAYLRRKARLYASLDETLDAAKLSIIDLLSSLLDDMAADGFFAGEADPDALTLDMSVSGVLSDARGAIDNILGAFCSESQSLRPNELFVPVREQLMRNLYFASGLNPDGPPSERPFVMASQAKPAPVPDLVETYLRHTPLKPLLSAALPIAIPEHVRSEHALILGGSGHGKTQLLQTLILHDLLQDSAASPGVIVIDSQGDLIETIARLPLFDPDAENSLSDRLVLIDPADIEFPVALNLFAFNQDRLGEYSRADRQRVLNTVIDLYEYFFTALLGAELTQKQGVVFRYLARLMLEIPNATVQTLRELMEDGRPFKPYMEQLEGSARRFFETEFFSRGFAATKTQILRRLWGVLANEVFERMFSHPENKVDLFGAMNEGKIILINTAKDLLKSEGCSIFGRFFIAKIAQAALERATLPEDERRPVHVYIDEAHDYFDETLEQLFNQARKYRVGLHVAAQNLDQMPTRLKSTVMASTSLKFAGGVSARDARQLADDMHTDTAFIQATRKRAGHSEFAAYVKNRTPNAIYVNVELGRLNKLGAMDDERFQALMDQNRERHCVPLDVIDDLIRAETPKPRSGGKSSTTPAESFKPAATDSAASQPATESDQETPTSETGPAPPPAITPSSTAGGVADRREEIDRYVAGVGGREHKKWQDRIRTIGQERGFKATIEKPVLDGKGSVDVALERDEVSIAVEVSNTTDVSHELGNAEKCIKAGFAEVYLLVPDPKKRVKIAQAIDERLSGEGASIVAAVGIDELVQALDRHAAMSSSNETTFRGYRVRTTYSAVSPAEAKFKREAVAKILRRSPHTTRSRSAP